MLTRAEKARRIAFIVVVLAALGYLVSKGSYGEHYSITEHWHFVAPFHVVLASSGNSADITTLDPARVAVDDTTEMIVVSQLFDGLVTFDDDLNVEPWDATSWDISQDGLTYTFTLAPMRFSDGAPVKATDFAWSLNRAIDSCLGDSANARYWTLIKDAAAFHAEACRDGQPDGAIKTLVGRSIIAEDGLNAYPRLTITLAHPAGYFLATLAYPWASVIEQRVVEETYPGGDHRTRLGVDGRWLDHLITPTTGQGGSGMFYLSKWDHDGNMTLKQNPNFSGRKPEFIEVDYTFVNASENPNAPFDAFTADSSLDYTNILPDTPEKPVTSLKNQSYYRAQPALSMSWLAFNQQQAPFNDINARKAFCLAINREQLNQQVYQGANLSRWDVIPPDLLRYNDILTGADNEQGTVGYPGVVMGIDHAPLAGNVGLAQLYWQKYLAAHGGHAPALTLYTSNPQSRQGQLTTSLSYQWEQALGISIRLDDAISHPLTATPLPVYVALTDWDAEYPDPQNFMSRAVL